MKQWEVWFAKFPFEEDNSIEKKRPVIIINVETLEVLSIKVTSHSARTEDEYDTELVHWSEAGLDKPSVARISKSMNLTKDKFVHKIGEIHDEDKVSIMQNFMNYITSKK